MNGYMEYLKKTGTPTGKNLSNATDKSDYYKKINDIQKLIAENAPETLLTQTTQALINEYPQYAQETISLLK